MVGSFYTFFVEVRQHLLNSWITGSRQVWALLGAGGRRRSTLAVVGSVPAGGAIRVSERQRRVLEALVRRSTAPQRLVRRAQMILMLAAGKRFHQVARALGGVRHAVYKWCDRWRTQAWRLAEVEGAGWPPYRPGGGVGRGMMGALRGCKPATFSPEQIGKVIAVAWEGPAGLRP